MNWAGPAYNTLQPKPIKVQIFKTEKKVKKKKSIAFPLLLQRLQCLIVNKNAADIRRIGISSFTTASCDAIPALLMAIPGMIHPLTCKTTR